MTQFLRLATFALLLALGIQQAPAQQWTPQTSGTTGDIWDVQFTDAQNGIAAVWILPGSAAILRTTNGGSTWTTPFEDINRGFNGVHFSTATTGYAVGGAFAYALIYRTTDGGASWTPQFNDGVLTEPRPALWSVHFPSSNIGYASGGFGVIMKTVNGGAAWSILPAQIPNAGEIINIHFIDDDTGFAVRAAPNDFVSGNELYRTTDGGGSWQLIAGFSVITAVNFVTDQIGYLVGNNGGPTVWKTTDGGDTWAQKYNGPGGSSIYLNSVDFTPENPFVGYAVGGNFFAKNNGIIIRTTDGGETWVEEETGLPNAMRWVDFPAETSGFAVGENGIILHTIREPLGEPQAKIRTSEDAIAFGQTPIGDTQNTTLLVMPDNVAGLEITSVRFEETNAGDLGFAFQTTPEPPLTLENDAQLSIDIQFTAQSVGPVEATLLIASNDQESPETAISLTGEGFEPALPGAISNVTEIDFGMIMVGSNAQESFTIAPANEAGLTVQSIDFTDAQQAAIDGFSLNVTPALPTELAENDAVEATLTFAPSGIGAKTAQLIVATNDAANPTLTVPVQGIGEAAVAVSEMRGDELALRLYPNPASKFTTIEFTTPASGAVAVDLINQLGINIIRIYSGPAHNGIRRVIFDTAAAPAGAYLCRLSVGDSVRFAPLVILR